MAHYYVSSAGDDRDPGSAARPWRSLDRLNAAFASQEVRRGDAVALRRGDVFTGRLVQPDSIDPNMPGWLEIGAYGDGAKPVVSGYQLLSEWRRHDETTWSHRTSRADVGLLNVDGELYGRRRNALNQLERQWDFFHAGDVLHVRSDTDPGHLAGSVKASVDQDGTNIRSGTFLRDISFIGHGGHGANAPGRGGTTRAAIIGCEFAEIGGAALDGYGAGDVRYGNGIQAWVGTRDLHVESNRIHDCYDAAMTLQGAEDSATKSFEDIQFRRNVAYRNSQSMEFWYQGSGPGYQSVFFDFNLCMFAGYGWGGDVRPEKHTRVHLLTFGWNSRSDVKLRRNLFYDAAAAYTYFQATPFGLEGQENIVAIRETVPKDLQREAEPWVIDIQSDLAGTDDDVAETLTWADTLDTRRRFPHSSVPVGGSLPSPFERR